MYIHAVLLTGAANDASFQQCAEGYYICKQQTQHFITCIRSLLHLQQQSSNLGISLTSGTLSGLRYEGNHISYGENATNIWASFLLH